MKSERQKRLDRILVAFTAIVLLALAGLAVFAIQRNQKLTEAHLEQRLASDQQLARVRISSSAHQVEEVLRLEGAWLSALPTLPTEEQCMERWRPLLHSQWAWLKVGVADEHGNAISLETRGDTLLLRTTEEGSQLRPAQVRILHPSQGTSEQASVVSTEEHDPRASLWFSKALEDARNTPIWTITREAKNDVTLLQLSILLRPVESDAPFRVIVIEADPERIAWLNEQGFANNGEGHSVLTSDGRILNKAQNNVDPELRAAMASAVQQWDRGRGTGPFHVEHKEQRYLASFSPIALNGQTLYSGVLLDASMPIPLLELQRRWLFLIAAFLIVLGVLLGTLWWRSLVAAADLRRKERRNRSQELRLAKALDEREVLNREVHHRVKNNLQVVSSLLNLQASGMDNEAVRSEFLRGKRRIDTIALVHHKLYALKDFRNVDIDLFFGALTQATAESNLPQSRTVSFEVATQGLKCDQDTAIGLGIILCELMTNAFQHAFPYATGGHIDVLVQAVEGDLHRLVVKDNGKGLDLSSSAGNGKLGLEIVDALSDQLDGSFHRPNDGGNTFEVLFRMRTSSGSAESVGSDTNGGEEASAGL